jgi:hypothetical protein
LLTSGRGNSSSSINIVEEDHIYFRAIRGRPVKLWWWSSDFKGKTLWANSSDLFLQFPILAEIMGRGSWCAVTALIRKRKHKSPMAVYLREGRGRNGLNVGLWARSIMGSNKAVGYTIGRGSVRLSSKIKVLLGDDTNYENGLTWK